MGLDLVLQPKQCQLYDILVATGNVPTTIGGGGAKGGGKSAGARNIALLLASELGNIYPGIPITIVRRVARDLRDNHIVPLLIQHPELAAYWQETAHDLVLPNQARIQFRSAETKGDVMRQFLGGFQSAILIVDEAQQFDEEELQWMRTGRRWTTPQGVPDGLCKTVMLFNPGGRGSPYLRRSFWTKEYTGRERPENYAFIHMFGWDNYEWFRGQVSVSEQEFYELDSETRFQMFITQTSYGREMNEMPESIRAGYLLGSFDHFEGQYFAGAWDPEKCILATPLVEKLVQPWWVRWMGQDWGFGDHTCHLWAAAGKVKPSDWEALFGGTCTMPMDVVVIYREYVINQRAEADMATDIVSLTPPEERKHIARFFMSQDAFGHRAKQSGANSVGEQFTRIMGRYGLPSPEPADQDRVNGWRFMYNCLRQTGLRGANIGEERAKQGPVVFVSAECVNVIGSIPMAVRDDKNVDDVMRVAGALWEDVTDACRYLLKSMLDPHSKAPRDVRAKEVYHSVKGDDDDAMTKRAMLMRKFDEENPRRRLNGPPRWRPNS